MEILILVFACVNLIILEQKRANLVSVSVLSRMLELLWLAARWKPETSFALVPNTSLLPHQNRDQLSALCFTIFQRFSHMVYELYKELRICL